MRPVTATMVQAPAPGAPRHPGRLLFRPWAAPWSPYRRSPQRWRHSSVALRPTSDARNRRVPADTLRDAVQSAYNHTQACRLPAPHGCGWRRHDERPASQPRFQSSLRLRRQATPWPPVCAGTRSARHHLGPGTDRRQEVQMPRSIPFLVLALTMVGTLSPQTVEPIRGDGRRRSSMPRASISSCDIDRVMIGDWGTTGYSSYVWVGL
jgi:hypothetical protein